MQHEAYKPHKTVVFYGSDSRQQLNGSLDYSRDFFVAQKPSKGSAFRTEGHVIVPFLQLILNNYKISPN